MTSSKYARANREKTPIENPRFCRNISLNTSQPVPLAAATSNSSFNSGICGRWEIGEINEF